MPDTLHVVLGATGHTGTVVAHHLLDAKKRVRVVGRSAERLRPFTSRGAEAAVGSLEVAGFPLKALTGAQAAYLLLPPNLETTGFRAYQERLAAALSRAVESARLGHVVTLSSIGANLAHGNGPIAGLHELEQRLDSVRGLNVLHLRAGFFMENLLMSIGMVKQRGFLGGAIRADLPMQMIATADIGEVAAARLAARDFTGSSTLELMGPRDVTLAQAATAVGKAVGKPDLRYLAAPYHEARKGLTGMGLTEELADLYVEMARGFNEGIIRAMQPRSAATTTPTAIETFAEKVFAPAFRAGRG